MKNVFILLALSIMAGSCTTRNNRQSEKLEKVKIQIDWKIGSEHAFLFAGVKQGYFKDSGIDLEIVPGTGSSSSANMVNAKSVDFALCSGETALQSRCAETPLNIKVIAEFYPSTPTVIYSLAEKNIIKPEDLYGKKLGVIKGSSAYRNYVYFSKRVKLDISRIEEIPTTGDIRELVGKNSSLDAMVHFGFQHPLKARLEGYRINEIKLSDSIQIYGQGLITHIDLIEKNPSLVKKIVEAIQKSYLFSIENPVETMFIFLEENPDNDIQYANKKFEWVTSFVKSGIDQNKIIGFQNSLVWEKTYDYLKSQNLVTREIILRDFWTNNYLNTTIKIK
jgi:NitT/TauT family transport system substrate-binding protein